MTGTITCVSCGARSFGFTRRRALLAHVRHLRAAHPHHPDCGKRDPETGSTSHCSECLLHALTDGGAA